MTTNPGATAPTPTTTEETGACECGCAGAGPDCTGAATPEDELLPSDCWGTRICAGCFEECPQPVCSGCGAWGTDGDDPDDPDD